MFDSLKSVTTTLVASLTISGFGLCIKPANANLFLTPMYLKMESKQGQSKGRLGISTLINPQLKDTDYAVYFNYQPSDKLNINFNNSSSSHDLRLNWRALNNLAFRLGNNNRDSITAGLTFSKSDRNFSQLITIDYGSNRALSQRIYAHFNALQFAHQFLINMVVF